MVLERPGPRTATRTLRACRARWVAACPAELPPPTTSDVVVAEALGVGRHGRVVEARPAVALGVGHRELAPAGAGGDDHGARRGRTGRRRGRRARAPRGRRSARPPGGSSTAPRRSGAPGASRPGSARRPISRSGSPGSSRCGCWCPPDRPAPRPRRRRCEGPPSRRTPRPPGRPDRRRARPGRTAVRRRRARSPSSRATWAAEGLRSTRSWRMRTGVSSRVMSSQSRILSAYGSRSTSWKRRGTRLRSRRSRTSKARRELRSAIRRSTPCPAPSCQARRASRQPEHQLPHLRRRRPAGAQPRPVEGDRLGRLGGHALGHRGLAREGRDVADEGAGVDLRDPHVLARLVVDQVNPAALDDEEGRVALALLVEDLARGERATLGLPGERGHLVLGQPGVEDLVGEVGEVLGLHPGGRHRRTLARSGGRGPPRPRATGARLGRRWEVRSDPVHLDASGLVSPIPESTPVRGPRGRAGRKLATAAAGLRERAAGGAAGLMLDLQSRVGNAEASRAAAALQRSPQNDLRAWGHDLAESFGLEGADEAGFARAHPSGRRSQWFRGRSLTPPPLGPAGLAALEEAIRRPTGRPSRTPSADRPLASGDGSQGREARVGRRRPHGVDQQPRQGDVPGARRDEGRPRPLLPRGRPSRSCARSATARRCSSASPTGPPASRSSRSASPSRRPTGCRRRPSRRRTAPPRGPS